MEPGRVHTHNPSNSRGWGRGIASSRRASGTYMYFVFTNSWFMCYKNYNFSIEYLWYFLVFFLKINWLFPWIYFSTLRIEFLLSPDTKTSLSSPYLASFFSKFTDNCNYFLLSFYPCLRNFEAVCMLVMNDMPLWVRGPLVILWCFPVWQATVCPESCCDIKVATPACFLLVFE